jgi:hypothetical protein
VYRRGHKTPAGLHITAQYQRNISICKLTKTMSDTNNISITGNHIQYDNIQAFWISWVKLTFYSSSDWSHRKETFITDKNLASQLYHRMNWHCNAHEVHIHQAGVTYLISEQFTPHLVPKVDKLLMKTFIAMHTMHRHITLCNGRSQVDHTMHR